ncbi:MAG: hypothetical protein ACREAI_02025, partial [Nitrososphaera sp.]
DRGFHFHHYLSLCSLKANSNDASQVCVVLFSKIAGKTDHSFIPEPFVSGQEGAFPQPITKFCITVTR